MDANDLRALADALEPMAKAPRFEDFDVPAFCAWVRAQADAQPVAWRCEVRGDGSNPAWDGFGWRHYHTTTSEREAQAFVARCGDGIEGRAVPLYAHPAPAAPHYAMLDSHRRLVEQAIQSAEHPSGMSTHDGKARIDASILRRMLAIIDSSPAAPQAMEDANVWKQIVPDDEPQAEPKLGELMREQRNSRIVAGAYPDGNPNAGAIMAQTSQAEPSAALIRAYNSGYMQGHHDIVEAQFIDIHPLDMDTYHADVVAELGLTAAPQAEPCIGNDSACPCQDGDACHYKDAADGTKAWPVPQAEPKREPLSDEQIELPDYLRLQIASTAAAHDVLVERRRQIESEGWTPEHDDEHVLGEMAALAAFYAVPDGVRDWDFSSTGYGDTLAEALLPNGWTAKAGEDRRRDLVKAGALILAEIERIDRMGGSDAE